MTVETGRYSIVMALPSNAIVRVYNHGTQTLASLYTDKSTGTAAPNPIQADGFGTLSFFAVPGDYDLAFPGHEITVTVRPDPANAWTGS